jgi:transcriptional regulator with XRE-family HTH domain
MDISSKVRTNIKRIRLEKGVSQGELARKLSVHPTYISQIERGIRNPTLTIIEKIAKALNTPIHKLIK